MGETVELAMILLTGQSINATGVVRWVSTDPKFPGVGVQFTVLSNRDKRLIQKLLDERD